MQYAKDLERQLFIFYSYANLLTDWNRLYYRIWNLICVRKGRCNEAAFHVLMKSWPLLQYKLVLFSITTRHKARSDRTGQWTPQPQRLSRRWPLALALSASDSKLLYAFQKAFAILTNKNFCYVPDDAILLWRLIFKVRLCSKYKGLNFRETVGWEFNVGSPVDIWGLM